MKIINLLILTLLFAVTAEARVFNSTEEITLQPAVGFNVDFIAPSLSASQPLKLGAAKELVTGTIDLASEVNGTLPIANGGTGSATQNFVDLSTAQSISGSKTFNNRFQALSTTEGYLPCPVMTEVQRDAIGAPVEGDCIYNSDSDLINVYDGAAWQLVGGVSGLTADQILYGGGTGLVEQDANLSYVSGTQTFSIGGVDVDGVNSQISNTLGGNDLSLSGGANDVVIEGLEVSNQLLTTNASPGNVTVQGKGTGHVILSDAVEFVSVSAPATPSSGSVMLYTDTTSELLSYVSDTGIKRTVKDFKQTDVISNPSFEDSYAGDPNIGWTVSSGSATVETGTFLPTEGKQALLISLTAENFSRSQTFDCSDYDAVPLGFTVWVQTSLSNVQVCGFDGTNDVNCVDVAGDVLKQYLAENSGGGTCGIKIKSTAPITGTVLLDGVRFTDQPYRFVDLTESSSIMLEGNDGRVITANTEDIQFNGTGNGWTSTGDTHFYTVQKSNSIVKISARVHSTGAVTQRNLSVYKNGTIYKTIGTDRGAASSVVAVNGSYVSSEGEFSAGDQLSLRIANTSTLQTGFNERHFLNIVEARASQNVVTPLNSNLTDWTDYSPTIVGFGTTTNDDFRYRRVGDSIEIVGKFTRGTLAATEAQFPLPTGLTIDSTKVPTIRMVGKFTGNAVAATAVRHFNILATGGDAFLNFSASNYHGTNNPLLPQNGTAAEGSSTEYSLYATIPITGYESEATILGAFPFDTVQENFLTADVLTTTGDISDLTFTGLVVGDWYELSGQVQSNVAANTNQIDFRSASAGGGSKYGEFLHSDNSQTTTGVNLKFKAVSTSLFFNASILDLRIFGDGTTEETFFQLTRLKTTSD